MPGKKRELEEDGSLRKLKKMKFSDAEAKAASILAPEEIDFPRGGGKALAPLGESGAKSSKKRKEPSQEKKKEDNIRVEHLNYKRVVEGMRIFGQVATIQPLALIISLPSQLFGHVPITQVSNQLTKCLEASEEEELTENHSEDHPRKAPELFEMFRVGQYVRAIVTAVRPAGATAPSVMGSRRRLDEMERACQRVELSLIPEQVNAGLVKQDLTNGFVLTAAVQSVEDHGYILDLGVSSVSAFLSFGDAKEGQFPHELTEGHVFDVCISKMSENGRTCTVAVGSKTITSSSLSQITSITSVLPGTLVQALITAVRPSGLNVQLLGYFEGTIDLLHLPPGDITTHFKAGQKIKARILWDMITSDPRKFALSLLPNTLDLDVPRMNDKQALQDAFPIGTILEAVKVVRVETEGGLLIEIQECVRGYVHIRHVSDDHVPSLSQSSGHWKVGTIHRARVIGFHTMDGILQLSLRESVLAQKFLQVADVEVGESLKATVKKLTSSGLFVTISANVDGVIWPNHYADITLKHPQKRFKEGAIVKCRVLVVDPDRKRIALTAKKTLVESELPIVAQSEDVQVGRVAHAVVFKVLEKALLVEFYNNIRAQVPLHEVSETHLDNLAEAFPVGKPVKVLITRVDLESWQVFASIRQATVKTPQVPDVQGVQVGEVVHGHIQTIHKDQVVMKLQPTGITALLSIKNLANSREMTVAQLRAGLTIGEQLDDLVVLSQIPEKRFVIVSKHPKSKSKPAALAGNEGVIAKDVRVGQVLSGRVTGFGRGGSTLHITNSLKGTLHPTDSCDDYSAGTPFPNVDTVINGVVVNVEKSRRYVAISTRPSRLRPEETLVPRDREISSVEDLKVGDVVRGFIKSIVDHGLFVSLGRTVDARVQIRELFDEYEKDWKLRFEVHQLVQGKIVRVDITANQVEMSLRSGPVINQATLSDFHESQKVDTTIKKIAEYGVFLEIKDTKISGLCHKSEISDNAKADVDQAIRGFQEGDPVRAIILTVNLEKQRISFGLKPSYFTDGDFEMHDTENSPDEEEVLSMAAKIEDAKDSESGDESEVLPVDTNLSPVGPSQPQISHLPETVPEFKLQGGFNWSGEAPEVHDTKISSGSDSDSEVNLDFNRGKSAKNTKKKKTIEYDRTGDLHTRKPESTADFERLLLSSPNSSYLWIQYMSFQLQLSEIDKAREVGKRALQTINFREEQEKMNVWIALLNLENKFGTDESLAAALKNAARHNDAKTIHLRMAAIFDESGQHDQATEQYQRTCKKFGKSSKVWSLFGEHYLKREDPEAARALLSRSLQSLEKHKQLKTITKFAQLEYRLGDVERGRTIFEGIVNSHPKRWDLWSIYADMEATKQNIQGLRNIFNRVLGLKMTSHKAKAFFKKWLVLEKEFGDDDGVNTVKEKAIAWTRMASGVTL